MKEEIAVKQRKILWCLTFSGVALNHIIQIIFSISIIDMINSNSEMNLTKTTIVTPKYFEDCNYSKAETIPEERFFSLERTFLDVFDVSCLNCFKF